MFLLVGTYAYTIAKEIFPQGPQTPAFTLGAVINWLTNAVVALYFPMMKVRNIIYNN